MTIFSGRGLTSIYTVLFRMLKEECSKEKFKFNHTPLEDFTNCLWQRQPNILPVWIAYRLILFLYFVATYALVVFRKPVPGYFWYKSMIFLAHWIYLAEVLTFGVAFAVTLEKFLKDKKKDPELPPREDSSEIPVRERTPWHYKTLWCLYNVVASTALSVTTLFWFFIYNPDVHLDVGFSIVTRVLNSAFLVLDIFLNAIPFRFLHIYLPFIFIFVYAIFSVIYQASGGTGVNGLIPIYRILDWRNPKQALSTGGVFLACVLLFHCGMCVINLFKNWLKKPTESGE